MIKWIFFRIYNLILFFKWVKLQLILKFESAEGRVKRLEKEIKKYKKQLEGWEQKRPRPSTYQSEHDRLTKLIKEKEGTLVVAKEMLHISKISEKYHGKKL